MDRNVTHMFKSNGQSAKSFNPFMAISEHTNHMIMQRIQQASQRAQQNNVKSDSITPER